MRLTLSWVLTLAAIVLPICTLVIGFRVVYEFDDGDSWDILGYYFAVLFWAACLFAGLVVLAVAEARPRSTWFAAARRALVVLLGIACLIPALGFWGLVMTEVFTNPQSISEELAGLLDVLAFLAAATPITLLGVLGGRVLYTLWRDFRRPAWLQLRINSRTRNRL